MIAVYTANDLARFIQTADMDPKSEREYLKAFYNSQNSWLSCSEPVEYSVFKRKIYDTCCRLECCTSISDLNLIFQEYNLKLIEDDGKKTEKVFDYFKQIRLSLLRDDVKYRKIKLRKLLKKFGYKRRSDKLLQKIEQSMCTLRISPYIRGGFSCNIRETDIDDMIVFRLNND